MSRKANPFGPGNIEGSDDQKTCRQPAGRRHNTRARSPISGVERASSPLRRTRGALNAVRVLESTTSLDRPWGSGPSGTGTKTKGPAHSPEDNSRTGSATYELGPRRRVTNEEEGPPLLEHLRPNARPSVRRRRSGGRPRRPSRGRESSLRDPLRGANRRRVSATRTERQGMR